MFFLSSYVAQLPALTVLPISSWTFSGRNKQKGCVPARKPTPSLDLVWWEKNKTFFQSLKRERIFKAAVWVSLLCVEFRDVGGLFPQHHTLISTHPSKSKGLFYCDFDQHLVTLGVHHRGELGQLLREKSCCGSEGRPLSSRFKPCHGWSR